MTVPEVVTIVVAVIRKAEYSELIDRELHGLTTSLRLIVESELGSFTTATRHLFTNCGKMLRPALLFACAAYGPLGTDTWSTRTRNLAAAVELLHVATLYHDDIMDGADSRRGVESANSAFGAPIAVLAGDFLLSKAMDLANSAGPQAAGFIIDALRSLCVGQAMEVADCGNLERTVEDYLRSIKGKTADLFGVACALGTVEASMLDSEVRRFMLYGENIGMAFQIADDILDLYGESEQAGKPVRNDLAEGVFTLPVLEAFRREPGLRAAIPAEIDDESTEWLRRSILECGALDASIQTVENYAQQALNGLPRLTYDTPESDCLADIPNRIMNVVSQLRSTTAPLRSVSGE